MSRKSYDRKNLVVLIFSENECYTEVVLPDNPKVKKSGTAIDEGGGTWTAPDPNDPAKPAQTQEIGRGRYFGRCDSHWGVVGVYDRTNLGHLNAMVSDACNATDKSPSYLED
jgi:hypothetical protein